MWRTEQFFSLLKEKFSYSWYLDCYETYYYRSNDKDLPDCQIRGKSRRTPWWTSTRSPRTFAVPDVFKITESLEAVQVCLVNSPELITTQLILSSPTGHSLLDLIQTKLGALSGYKELQTQWSGQTQVRDQVEPTHWRTKWRKDSLQTRMEHQERSEGSLQSSHKFLQVMHNGEVFYPVRPRWRHSESESEFFSHCRHKEKHLLRKSWKSEIMYRKNQLFIVFSLLGSLCLYLYPIDR